MVSDRVIEIIQQITNDMNGQNRSKQLVLVARVGDQGH
jgi:hypothetical protein